MVNKTPGGAMLCIVQAKRYSKVVGVSHVRELAGAMEGKRAGGVEDTDASVAAALRRELAEEWGAEAAVASQVFLVSSPSDTAVAVQHFFVVRLASVDESARSGPNSAIHPGASTTWTGSTSWGMIFAPVDPKPTASKEFILANRKALLVEAPPVG